HSCGVLESLLAEILTAWKQLAVASSPDGQRIAIYSSDGFLQVWKRTGGEPLFKIRMNNASISEVHFSTDSRRLIAVSGGGIVRTWDATDGTRLPAEGEVSAVPRISRPPEFRARPRSLEVMLTRPNCEDPVAWFPATLDQIESHPDGRTWA